MVSATSHSRARRPSSATHSSGVPMSESGERRTASGAWPSILPKLSASARVACGAFGQHEGEDRLADRDGAPVAAMARRLLAREARLGAEALVGQLAHLGER